MVFGQELFVDPWLVVESLQVGLRDEMAQVVVALVVLCEKDKMKIGLAGAIGLAIEATPVRDIAFATDDGFHAFFAGRFVEINNAVHHAMVRHCDGWHLKLCGSVDEIADSACPVQNAVSGVYV